MEHSGGQLKVSHKGKDITFDWSASANDADHGSIRWAAFYSDCEHEVLEVTSGHRVTLTYNLYAVRGHGSLAGNCPTLDTRHLLLYPKVDALLKDKHFMEHGEKLPPVRWTMACYSITDQCLTQVVLSASSAAMRMRTTRRQVTYSLRP